MILFVVAGWLALFRPVDWRDKYVHYLLFSVVILGGLLRICCLGDKSLWLDEFFSINDSQTLSATINGGHPPLSYIILFFFRYMGNEEFFLRLPSAIFGILTVLTVYKVGEVFWGPKEGLIGAFLLSISPFHIDYSQQARMYTIFTFLSMLSLFFFYKALKEDKKEFWAGFILSTALVLYTHYFAVLVVFAEAVLSIIFLLNQVVNNREESSIKKNLFSIVLSFLAVLVFYLPLIFDRFSVFTKAVGGFSVFAESFSWFANTPPQLSFYTTLLSDFSAGGGIALALFLFFFLCGMVVSVRDLEGIFSLLWIGLTIASVTIISTLFSPVIGTNALRYIIFILPVYLLVISRGILSVAKIAAELIKKPAETRKISTSTIAFIVILLSAISLAPLQTYYRAERENWRDAARYIDVYSQSNDVLAIDPDELTQCILYYYDTNSKNVTVLPIHGDVEKLIDICSRHNRVWIIFNDRYASLTQSTLKNWLYRNLSLVREFTGDIQIYLKQQTFFRAAILGHFEWGSQIPWESMLALMGASTSTFDDKTDISSLDFSDFDFIVFADFLRVPSEAERLHLKESIQKGLHVIVSGLSSPYIAGGTTNLTSISQWFGANLFSEAPATEKWKVKFTENATEVMKDVDLKVEYAFYTNSDWSTPTGCVTDPESIVYAYRVNDDAATIFTHQFGEGISIFVGPRDGFYSSDAEIFTAFLRSLILSQLE